ncbi:MAG: tyramine oxidase subunit B [Lachnospiraceae bacterium]|nr:ornithine cyclodeaminase [Lachnospiraceae bacterium]MCI6331865.1 tyramine oxidase subunit B [Lachnospiraceae bacterium]MCI6665655.1 tyramine oxidase subunit B [Lachnospiraceae bacterium]MCI6978617.1 tyramine oxidase subunit B [Lachnospiraceae bacterium]MDD7224376.1 tyramine oxidase subunit B [Lachnospiraceae bacterium]
MKIDFLYLNEEDMIKSGVLDAKRCIETMRDTLSLFGKKDFLLGGPKGDEHGLQMNFPKKSDIENFPLDDGPDRRFMAMPAYLGGRFHIAGQKYYGSNSHNNAFNLPRSILMVTLSDVDTGAPKAIMSANLLSAMRTGAMPAMAATYLANKDSEVLSLIGPGVINKCALMCYMEVLPNIKTIKLRGSSSKSKTALDMKQFIMEKYPNVKDIIICDSLKEACEDADVVSEAMSVSPENLEEFKLEWFKKGATVFSMGSFLYRKYDDFTNTKMVVDNYGMYEKYLSNFIARGPVDELGNKREWVIMGIHFVHLVKSGVVTRDKVINICDIVNGTSKGRENKDEIVMCSIGGMPLEDLSWGYDCYQKALELGIGTKLNLWNEPYMK